MQDRQIDVFGFFRGRFVNWYKKVVSFISSFVLSLGAVRALSAKFVKVVGNYNNVETGIWKGSYYEPPTDYWIKLGQMIVRVSYTNSFVKNLLIGEMFVSRIKVMSKECKVSYKPKYYGGNNEMIFTTSVPCKIIDLDLKENTEWFEVVDTEIDKVLLQILKTLEDKKTAKEKEAQEAKKIVDRVCGLGTKS